MFEGTNQIHFETALTLNNVMFGEETQTNFYTIMGVFNGSVHHLLFNNGFIKAAQDGLRPDYLQHEAEHADIGWTNVEPQRTKNSQEKVTT